MHVIQTQAPPAVVGPWSKATACIFEVYQESRRGERGAFIGYLHKWRRGLAALILDSEPPVSSGSPMLPDASINSSRLPTTF